MSLLQKCAIILAVITIVLSFYKLTIWRANIILRRWALEKGFEVLRFERCFFTGGFGWFTTSRNQVVYSILIKDRWNEERSGWLRCGSYFGGVLFSNEAEVKWNVPPPDPSERA
jgi:hypothetical protein